jgi:transposase
MSFLSAVNSRFKIGTRIGAYASGEGPHWGLHRMRTTNPAYHFKRIGLEAGPLSQWLFSALAETGLPVICVETRQCVVVALP